MFIFRKFYLNLKLKFTLINNQIVTKFTSVMEFVKNEEILELASSEIWSRFALKIHSVFQAAPCVLNRCDMLEHLGGNFDASGRCRVRIKLPGLKRIFENPAIDKFPVFPSKSNGKKIALPLYLNWVLYQVEKEVPEGCKWDESKNNHFALSIGSEVVQILIYGINSAFPFQVSYA